jgi:hypothetical protein
VGYLKQNQQNNGAWNDKIGAFNHPGGASCLAMLALLNAGVPTDDPCIKHGLKYLRGLDRPTTYVRSLQTMVYVRAGQPEDQGRIQANVDHLLRIQVRDGRGRLEGWSYDHPGNPGARTDNSNTHYAVMALHTARAAGAKIKREVWEGIREFYLRAQNDDGGWGYTVDTHGPFRKDASTLTMTIAGLSGLLISGMELNEGREKIRADGTAADCGVYKENEPVKRALSWISSPRLDRFQFDLPQRTFYNIHGLERAGRLSGMRFFHSHDWYHEGCEFLLKRKRMDPNGGWYWSEGGVWDSWPIVSTSFSLLFLSKGRTPVLLTKLVHGVPRSPDDSDWNSDRNDCRHLVAFAGRELFKRQPVTWQSFDILNAVKRLPKEDEAEVASDLLESPVVYITGHKSPDKRITAVEKAVLKAYVAGGGVILAEACCGSKAFDKGFHALCKELWPASPLKDLPKNHPVWKAPFPLAPGAIKLKGFQLGGKTAVIYSPEDLSCLWEADRRDTPAGVQAFRLGTNILAYAAGKEAPRPRLSRARIPQPPKE